MNSRGLFALADLVEVLLGILALVARQRDVFQGVGLVGQGGLDFLLDGLQRLAGLVRTASIADADALAGLRLGSNARVVELLVGLLFGPIALALAFTEAVAFALALVLSLALAVA